jgi:hypothetical protein
MYVYMYLCLCVEMDPCPPLSTTSWVGGGGGENPIWCVARVSTKMIPNESQTIAGYTLNSILYSWLIKNKWANRLRVSTVIHRWRFKLCIWINCLNNFYQCEARRWAGRKTTGAPPGRVIFTLSGTSSAPLSRLATADSRVSWGGGGGRKWCCHAISNLIFCHRRDGSSKMCWDASTMNETNNMKQRKIVCQGFTNQTCHEITEAGTSMNRTQVLQDNV